MGQKWVRNGSQMGHELSKTEMQKSEERAKALLSLKKTVLSIQLLKILFLEILRTKFQLPYIAKLIQSGTWFDGSKSLIMKTQELEPDYAPNYILQNPTNFKQLLQP